MKITEQVKFIFLLQCLFDLPLYVSCVGSPQGQSCCFCGILWIYFGAAVNTSEICGLQCDIFFGNIHAWKHLNRKVNQKQNDDILDCFFSPESRQTWYCPGWRCHSCWSLHYWKYSISWVFDTICFSNLKKWQPAFSKAVAFGWHGRTLQ